MDANYIVAAWIRSLTGRIEILDSLLTATAEYGAFVIPPTLVVLFLLRGKNRGDSLFVFFSILIGIGLSYIVQGFYVHERPFEIYDTLLSDAVGDTFPSQHASTLFPFSLAFLYRGRKILGLVFLSWTVVNTFSRIAVGYHFPLDILAGLLIGAAAVLALGQFETLTDKFSNLLDRIENKVFSTLRRN